jgi:hypothetical protein
MAATAKKVVPLQQKAGRSAENPMKGLAKRQKSRRKASLEPLRLRDKSRGGISAYQGQRYLTQHPPTSMQAMRA